MKEYKTIMLNRLHKLELVRKAHLFLMAFALLAALSGHAQTVPHYIYIPQYHYIPSGSGTPWTGQSAVALYAGTGAFNQPINIEAIPSTYRAHLPFTASIRYALERNLGKHFIWGWRSEHTFYHYGYDYEDDGNKYSGLTPNGTPIAGHNIESSISSWFLAVDWSMALGYTVNRSLTVSLSAGLSIGILGNSHTTDRYVNRTNGLIDDKTDGNNISFFEYPAWVFHAEVQYFFYKSYFVSLDAKARIGFLRDRLYNDTDCTNHYSILLGVGYKAFNKKSNLSND